MGVKEGFLELILKLQFQEQQKLGGDSEGDKARKRLPSKRLARGEKAESTGFGECVAWRQFLEEEKKDM